MNKRIVILAALILLFVSFPSPASLQDYRALPFSFPGDQSRAPADGAGAADVPWEITADRIEASHGTNVIEAWGDVTLWQADSYLRADYVRYYTDTHWVLLQGSVQIKWQKDYLQSREAEFDLVQKTGWLKDGSLFVTDPHIYFSGSLIERLGGQSYLFREARVTSCDSTPAPWSMTASDGLVTLDGNAQLWHVAMRVKDTPVLYSPYAVVPVLASRQSGFLMPEVALSTLLGAQINLPYYWAIDPEHDMTLYENAMSKRGLMHGGEYRLATDSITKGMWRFDYLNDRQVVMSEAEDEVDSNDGLIRPNNDRWWLRGKYDGWLADPEWLIKFDLDMVSDQNYLREFKRGASGFNTSRDAFLKTFRRDLEENDSLIRTSTLLVNRDYENFGVAGLIQYNQNLAYMNDNLDPDKNPTLQRMPNLSAFFYKSRLAETPLEWEADNSLSYFWRQYGSTGSRLDLHPVLQLPLMYEGMSFIPKLAWRQTGYAVDRYENESSDIDEEHWTTRGVPEVGISAFTEWAKVFDLQSVPAAEPGNIGRSVWTKLKHSVQPRVSYDYVPYADQSSIPVFDALDRIQPRNELTYSLTNLLTRRKDTVLGKPDDNGDLQLSAERDYLEAVSLRLTQSYDFREATRTEERDKYDRRPFSDILTELTLRFDRRLSLVNNTFYSPYLNVVTEHEHLLRYLHEDYGTVYLGLDYLKGIDEYKRRTTDPTIFAVTHLGGLSYEDFLKLKTESFNVVKVGGEAFISDKFHVGGDYQVDFQQGRDIEKDVYFIYSDQCYNLRVEFSQTPSDDRVEVRVDLIGVNFL